MIREYEVTLTGVAPGLIMHRDNIEWADTLKAWAATPEGKQQSVAGDDRSPSWRWLGSCYHDGKVLAIPADNIARCMMEGGALVPVPGGKSGKTFKSQTQSGMMSRDAFWPLLVNGKTIPWPVLSALMQESDFGTHLETCENHGFELLIKRAAVQKAKHVRVRPLFREWTACGVVSVWDDKITDAALTTIIQQAGQYKGLCDWRPGGRTPGPYGRFEATVKRLKA
jgi:hypothetical protein